MLDQVDGLIRTALLRGVPGLTTTEQVRFQPPDDDLRTSVANLGREVLSVYLVDLRENAALRNPEWHLVHTPGGPQRELTPARVDCHYLISAWSPATLTPAIEPTLDEHVLLYRALAVLFQLDPLNPSRVLPPGSAALAGIDPLIRNADLPTQVVPAEGWPKLGEFWSAMGSEQRWKPAVWFTVTIPVAYERQVAGPLVTTRIIEFRQAGKPDTAEFWLQLGGTVTDASGAPVPGAVVRLETGGGLQAGSAATGEDGRFSIGSLAPDGYQLSARRPDLGSVTAPVAVPGGAGEYDLTIG